MKKIMLLLFFLIVAVGSANAIPLGITLGSANCNDALKILDKKTKMLQVKTDPSFGELYEGDASNLGLENAISISLLCNSNKADLVEIKINKGTFSKNFQQYYQLLNSKYQLISEQLPFVGDKVAKFKSGDTLIILNAPHMSFNMRLIYLTKEMAQKLRSTASKKEENEKKLEEKNI